MTVERLLGSSHVSLAHCFALFSSLALSAGCIQVVQPLPKTAALPAEPQSAFGIVVHDAGGDPRFVTTSEVPNVEGQAYAWFVWVGESQKTVRWTERLTLPVAPATWSGATSEPNISISPDQRTAITQGEGVPESGFIYNSWSVAAGDPPGRYEIFVTLEDGRAEAFSFVLGEEQQAGTTAEPQQHSMEAAESADTTVFWEFSSGNWAGGAYKDENGLFSHCYVATSYVSEITMAIGITADYELQLALGHTGWDLPVGASYNVGLSVDGQFLGRFSAVAMKTASLLVHVGSRNDVLTRLRLGRQLNVAAAQETLYFSLDGTNRALKQVKECVDLAVALSPSRRNPFAAGGPQANPFEPDADESSEEVRGSVEALLVASGLAEPTFFDPSQIEFDEASYAWTSGDVVGVLFVMDASERGLDEASREILGGVAEGCDGTFASQSEASNRVGGSRLKQFSAACRSQLEGDSFFAVTAVESSGALMFVLNFTAADPGTVRDVNASLAEVLTVLLSK